MSNADIIRESFKLINDEGIEAVVDRYTDDAVAHATALAITANGKAEIREKLGGLINQINLKQEPLDVVEASPYVTATVRFTSTLRPEPVNGVVVTRFDGDRIVEQWTVTPPLPS